MLTNDNNLVYNIVEMKEGVKAWSDRTYVYTSVPQRMIGGWLFQGPVAAVPRYTVFTVEVTVPSHVYVLLQQDWRDGGFDTSLPADGWINQGYGPVWMDTSSVNTMKVLKRSLPAHGRVTLPATTTSQTVFSIVVVPIGVWGWQIRAWTGEGKGALRGALRGARGPDAHHTKRGSLRFSSKPLIARS